MTLIAGHNVGILVADLKPGDVVIKLNQSANLGAGWNHWGEKSFISNVISGFCVVNSEYVHGGLCVGQGRLIEVNGGIPPDNIHGRRVMANIYLTDLKRDLRKDSYDVWRCKDVELAEEVARQAYPFVPVGVHKSWSYNLLDVATAVGLGPLAKALLPGTSFDAKSGVPTGAPLPEKASAIDIAVAEKLRFYCTQFVVWLYNTVSLRILKRGQPAILMNDKEALPGYLAEVLHKRSANFMYVGALRGVR